MMVSWAEHRVGIQLRKHPLFIVGSDGSSITRFDGRDTVTQVTGIRFGAGVCVCVRYFVCVGLALCVGKIEAVLQLLDL